MGGPDDQPNGLPHEPPAPAIPGAGPNVGRGGLFAVGAVVLVTATIVIGILVGWAAALVPGVLAAVAGGAALRASMEPADGGPGRTDRGGREQIDPFTLSEPWRQMVQRAQRSERELGRIVAGVDEGPLHDRLATIVERLDGGVRETWRIARRGDAVDDAVRRLDPVGLRSRLQTARRSTDPALDGGNGGHAAVGAVESQLATVERLQLQSAEVERSLELAQLRVEELVSRAAEVSLGIVDTEAYASDVNDLVVELEALRLAIDETDRL